MMWVVAVKDVGGVLSNFEKGLDELNDTLYGKGS